MSNTFKTKLVRRHRLRATAQNRRAGSVLEMAFTLNLLMWLSMGMIEFGQFFYIRHAFDAAARDGGRVASLLTTMNATPITTQLTSTLNQANVSYNPAWLTITQTDPITNASVVVTAANIGTVPIGDEITLRLQTTYDQLPNALRPFNAITGKGIGNTKLVIGQATFVRG